MDERQGWVNRLAPIAIVVAVLGGVVGYALLAGKHRHFGEPCEQTKDCIEPGATCLVSAAGSICTRSCGPLSGPCPAGWSCRVSDEVNENGAKTGDMKQVCSKD